MSIAYMNMTPQCAGQPIANPRAQHMSAALGICGQSVPFKLQPASMLAQPMLKLTYMDFGTLIDDCCSDVQFVGLAFNMWEQYYFYAAILLALTLTSGFFFRTRLYKKKRQLYLAVSQRHIVPLVTGGIVR